MPRNSLTDMHNILMATLERLDNEELTEEELNLEIKRGSAISGVAKVIVDNSRLILDAHKTANEYGVSSKKMLTIEDSVNNEERN